MNEKTKLLKKATLDFTVKNVSCICFQAKRITLKNGFVYLLVDKNKSKKIDNITIHNNTRRELNEFGTFDIGELILQTQINLLDIFKESEDGEEDFIYLMKMADEDLYFSVYNLIAYNKEMNNYDYRAELLQNKNKSFVVYDITNITDNLINNSIPLWLLQKDRLDIPIFPAFASPINLSIPYLTVEIVETASLSMPEIDYKDNKIRQHKKDKIRLRGLNIELEKQQELAYNIQTLQNNYNENTFGITNLINFKSILNDNQKGFGVISNKCQAEFDINYNIETKRLYKSEDLIKELIIQLNIDNENITVPIFNLNEI